MAYALVVASGMFSGKTEFALAKLGSASHAGKNILVVKSKTDNRKIRDVFALIKEHKDLAKYKKLHTGVVSSVKELKALVRQHNPDILLIDEAQFLKGRGYVRYFRQLMEINKANNFMLMIVGLDMDAWGRPFGLMPFFMALADDVDKLKTAFCAICRDDKYRAVMTQKITGSTEQIEVGDKPYQPVCRRCHTMPPNEPTPE